MAPWAIPPRQWRCAIWVRLTSIQHLDLDGKQRTYRAGDWVDISKQLALKLLGEGAAVLAERAVVDVVGNRDAGVLLRGDLTSQNISAVEARFKKLGVALPVKYTDAPVTAVLPWEYTLLWEPSCTLRYDLLPVAFAWLEKWSICAPLFSYQQLARDLGTAEDRALTERVTHELRVPVYETRQLFLRRNDEAERLLSTWEVERANLSGKGDERLAFLRALYVVKPLVLALPATWLEPASAPTGR